jgi:hypothetical protein
VRCADEGVTAACHNSGDSDGDDGDGDGDDDEGVTTAWKGGGGKGQTMVKDTRRREETDRIQWGVKRQTGIKKERRDRHTNKRREEEQR